MIITTLEKKIQQKAKTHRVLGYSIQMINNFSLGDVFLYGYRDKNKKYKVDQKTLFAGASLSKTIATIVTLRLCEQGFLPLSSVRDYLSHAAGISVRGFQGYEVDQKIPNLDQIISGLLPANNEPIVKKYKFGRYKYSGGGYTLLQKRLEGITNKDFQQLAQKYVFNPLCLQRSTFKLMYPHKVKNVAEGKAPKSRLKGPWTMHPESAAAGLWTNPKEMANVVIEIMKALKNKKSIYSHWLARTMMHSRLKNVGLGTFTNIHKNGIEFSHDGANIGFRSRYIALPSGQGVVIMTNSDNGFDFINNILPDIAKEYRWGKFKLKL